MSAGLSLLTVVTISLALSTVLVRVLWVPLRRVLSTLCPTGEASQFWVSFTAVMLFIAPLLCAVFAMAPEGGQSSVWVVRSALLSTLLGATCALLAVGLKIANPSPPPGAPAGH